MPFWNLKTKKTKRPPWIGSHQVVNGYKLVIYLNKDLISCCSFEVTINVISGKTKLLKNVFRHPSTKYSTRTFQRFHKNFLYRQICPNSGSFLLKNNYSVIAEKELFKDKGMLLLHFLHRLNVETTCLSVIVVVGRSKKIGHTFSCNNMQWPITSPFCPDESLDNVDLLNVV